MRGGDFISSFVLTWHFVIFVKKSLWPLQKRATNEQLFIDAKKYLTDIKWEHPMYWCIFMNMRFDFFVKRFLIDLKKFFTALAIELKLNPLRPPLSFISLSFRKWSSYWVVFWPSSYKIILSLKVPFRVEPISQEFKLERKTRNTNECTN